MEQTNIPFQYGINRAPSQGEEGQLSECVNLIPKYGELKNVHPAEEISISSNQELLYIHTLSTGEKHYIFADGSFKGNNTGTISDWPTSEIKNITSIGDVLIINTEKLVYATWKDNGYNILADKPDFNITFTLQNNRLISESYERCVRITTKRGGENIIFEKKYQYRVGDARIIFPTSLSRGKYYIPIEVRQLAFNTGQVINYTLSDGTTRPYSANVDTTDITASITGVEVEVAGSEAVTFIVKAYSNQVEDEYALFHGKDGGEEAYTSIIGSALDFTAKCQVSENKLIFPFFVRYGLKLIGGVVVNISSPILMVPNWGNIPICKADAGNKDDDGWCGATFYANGSSLGYSLLIDNTLDRWKDVIVGIEVAISKPIYFWNQGKEYDPHKNYVSGTSFSKQNLVDVYSVIDDGNPHIFDKYPEILDGSIGGARMLLPANKEEQIRNNVSTISNFYVVHTINTDEIIKSQQDNGTYKCQGIIDGFSIPNIETLPTMADEFNSNNSFVTNNSFVYNNRLSLANITETLITAPFPASPIAENEDKPEKDFAFIYIKRNEKEVILKYEYPKQVRLLPMWLYYPDTDAYKIVLYMFAEYDEETRDVIYKKQIYQLKKHPLLNGAYWFDYTLDIEEELTSEIEEQESSDKTFSLPNYIYTSKVNNPFYFPPELQETIGSGEIKAVTTSAKALSQGQFGEFPLYAFCTDGIWALSVSPDGKYSTTNPVVRDVVENIDTICQVDAAVVFGTPQGLKILSGSDTQLISPAMEGENADESVFFDGVDSSLVVTDTNSFVSMLSEAKVLYDYANDLLRIYPADCEKSGKHYIYSIADQQWSTYVGEQVKTNIPGYPYSTIQDVNGNLLQYQPTDDTTTVRQGLILTRPMSFGSPIAMKILADMKMFYTKHGDANCKVAVFASNDQVKWYRLNSLRGHSFKWYRFRIKTELTDLDALSGMLVLHEQRRTNKLR